MADVNIVLKIPSEKVTVALEGFLTIYPNNEVVSQDDLALKYTNKEWVLEQIRRIVIRDIRRGLEMKRQNSNVIPIDDSLVTL